MGNCKRWMGGSWNWQRPVKSVVFIYLSVALGACLLANRVIFHPPPPQYSPEENNFVLLDPGPDQVACYFLPPSENEPILLWAHGNAEDLGLLKSIFVDVHNRGLGVLAYDYPGYGHSAGSPSERSCFRAADRAYQFLVDEQGIAPSRIILLGQSIGSGPACWLAERKQTAGLILLSPVLSAFRTLTQIPLLPGDRFNNLGRIRRIEEPLLVIHGTRDEEVPVSHGRRLFREHRGPKELLEITEAGHNDLWHLAAQQIIPAIGEFARRGSREE